MTEDSGNVGKLVRNIAITLAAIASIGFGGYQLASWSERRSKAQGQANYAQYQHLLKLADVDGNEEISPIEEILLMERVPFLKSWERYGKSVYDVTARTLTPACSFRDQEVDSAVRKYEKDRVGRKQ